MIYFFVGAQKTRRILKSTILSTFPSRYSPWSWLKDYAKRHCAAHDNNDSSDIEFYIAFSLLGIDNGVGGFNNEC